MANRTCFACHNQAHVMVAMREAENRGIAKVDPAFAEANANHTLKFLSRNTDAYKKGFGQGGQADTAGYALWLLEVSNTKPDETTSAVVEYLIQYHSDWGYWRSSGNRPPSEASHFSTTYAAIRGLKAFSTDDQRLRANERIARAKKWLEETPAADTEDAVFRLRSLTLVESETDVIAKAASELAALQRADGGWAQTKELTSDAYATGSAMTALAETNLPITSQVSFRRGVEYLLRTQHDDGTWRVTTRSKPFQEYFETGFPHEKDQFISSAATSWAVAALSMSPQPISQNKPGK